MANKEHASAQCKYYSICGRDVEGNPADGLCILHSTDSTKGAYAFAEALATHREHHGDRFRAFVFPEEDDFFRASFGEMADFSSTTFGERYKIADFSGARFSGATNFSRARFNWMADFHEAVFSGRALFAGSSRGTEVEYIFADTRVISRRWLSVRLMPCSFWRQT